VSWSRPVEAARVEAIGLAQAHRGPDGSGTLDWGWLGFAHRRLAILDLEGSSQPMTDPSGRFALTYNGEIFNYRELRAWLEGRGHEFRTTGDVEVLLRLLIEQGADAIPRLDGQFAFAFADRERGSVLLARDRAGIKPLHVARRDGELVFASEAGGILAAVPTPSISPESVDLFLTLRYVPAPWTIYDGIEKLPPGTWMKATRGGAIAGPHPWFRVDDPVDLREPAQEEIEATLAESVRAQLVADVPLLCLLSGGIDSSTVAVLAARALAGKARLRTVTVGLGGGPDERAHARVVARAIGSDHHEEEFDSAAGDDTSLGAFGEPFADSSVGPSAMLFRAAAARGKVALGGDGGDETFLGYRVYHRALTGELGRRALREGPALDGAIVRARRALSARYRALLLEPAMDAWRATRTIVGDRARRQLYRGTRLEGFPEPLPGTAYLAEVERRAVAASRGDPVRALMLADLLSFLPECCLVKVDRLSMRRGLEVRVPLLGNGPLALGLSLPTSRKAVVRGVRCVGGKAPLRRLLSRTVPELDVGRRKQGFGAPAAALRWNGPGGLAESVAGTPAIREWCDPGVVGALLDGTPMPGVRRGEAAFGIAALAAFLRRPGTA
jgi:asparagine synthase (glutamine-hydrolysing)